MAFWLGAALYPMIEVAWRGRTHPAMSAAGGVSLWLLSRLSCLAGDRPLWQQSLLGGLMITGVEYGVGRLCNRQYQIWDYRRAPVNIQGQICLPYTAAWCGLSYAALGAMKLLRR